MTHTLPSWRRIDGLNRVWVPSIEATATAMDGGISPDRG